MANIIFPSFASLLNRRLFPFGSVSRERPKDGIRQSKVEFAEDL